MTVRRIAAEIPQPAAPEDLLSCCPRARSLLFQRCEALSPHRPLSPARVTHAMDHGPAHSTRPRFGSGVLADGLHLLVAAIVDILRP